MTELGMALSNPYEGERRQGTSFCVYFFWYLVGALQYHVEFNPCTGCVHLYMTPHLRTNST